MNPEHLAQVADVYLEACGIGEPPTVAVQETWNVSRPTAGRWVMHARAQGLLPATTQGKAPIQSPKVAVVAQALGVTPDALERALLEHADGDLRIAMTRRPETAWSAAKARSATSFTFTDGDSE